MSGHGPAKFVIRLRAYGVPPELAAKLARQCEDILRDRAPAGIEVEPLVFHGSKFSPKTAEWSTRVRAEMRRQAELDHEERVKSRLEQAAGEEIEVL